MSDDYFLLFVEDKETKDLCIMSARFATTDDAIEVATKVTTDKPRFAVNIVRASDGKRMFTLNKTVKESVEDGWASGTDVTAAPFMGWEHGVPPEGTGLI